MCSDAVPPPTDAWLGDDTDPDVDGWFAHRLVFDRLASCTVDAA